MRHGTIVSMLDPPVYFLRLYFAAGLVTPALIGLESCWGLFFLRRPARFTELITVLTVRKHVFFI